MKTTMTWLVALTLSIGGLFWIGGLLSSGCYYEVCEPCLCGDGGNGHDDGGGGDASCQGPIEETAPQAFIQGYEAPGQYVTLNVGETLDLTAALSPDWSAPMECLLPITYHWDLGNGQTVDGESSGAFSYSDPGYYTVTMTASNSQGTDDQTIDHVYASIWSGSVFEDEFERDAIDHETSGWSYRASDSLDVARAPAWEIVNQSGSRRVHADWGPGTDFCQPATQGMLARLEATNARVSVWQQRGTPEPGRPHYSDIILRYRFNGRGVSGPDSSYYRARVQESNEGEEYCICLDAFKIEGENEAGTGLDGSDVNDCGNPRCGYTGDAFYVTVEITGGASSAEILLEVDAAPNASAPWHSHRFTDTNAPHTQAGRFGFSQCTGETYFDNFRLERLD